MANTKKKIESVSKADSKPTVKVIEDAEEVEFKPAKIVAKEVDLNEPIPVINGFQGKLVYISKRTGEKYVWEQFGDEQEIELRELKNAKSASKGFFENNWFNFGDEYRWVIDYLGVKQYYKFALNVDDFDEVFKNSTEEIENVISKLSKGQKRSVSYRARQLIAEGEIDSNKVIKALEKALNTELVER